MNIVSIEKQPNKDAIDVLEETLEKVKSGEIKSVAVAWVTDDEAIGGDISSGNSQFVMFTAIEHLSRTFYKDRISGE